MHQREEIYGNTRRGAAEEKVTMSVRNVEAAARGIRCEGLQKKKKKICMYRKILRKI